MKYFVQMMGGSSYSCSDEIEVCRNKKDVNALVRAFWHDLAFPSTPCAQDVTFWVYRVAPQENRDRYPDWVVTLGPRGGCQWSPA